MKSLIKITLSVLTLIVLVSCGHDKTKRNSQYMPDMYRPVPYEAYSTNPNFKDSLSSQKPVAGTIARGQMPYDYPDTNDGYNAAKLNLKSPIDSTQIDYKKGKAMYDIYCATCHGKKGDGNGVLSQRDKFVGIPNYNSRDITEGSIYHVIMYGRNMMGSHASQLRDDERWQVVHYVGKLRQDLLK
jgi:mono/diheme cytochrome c family protein